MQVMTRECKLSRLDNLFTSGQTVTSNTDEPDPLHAMLSQQYMTRRRWGTVRIPSSQPTSRNQHQRLVLQLHSTSQQQT
ncbi:hypothetical protein Pmani_034003 [Petrolisthes manimaculis]|uniref:Uncharacterized protein n=1 Tax=Petrolisthes manimaculis TaxID=1843537 RepID=A0AAE1TS20_9EUCA|nr:hypothetical protein Pmani_034003 [Petrolisthes manimaculis]